MFYGINDLTTFVIGTIVIVLLPGPNSLYVIALASRRGIAAGYRAAAGIFAGDLLLMLATATGAASLLHTHPTVFLLIKYAGAAYLAWVGAKLLHTAWKGWNTPTEAESAPPVQSGRPFSTALLISLLNPKAILFFISFFIQFVDPGYAYPALSFAILGLIVQLCSALYLTVLIFAGARMAAQFRRRQRLAAGATGSVGGLFLGFGAKLAGASLG